ncbi:MAG: pectin acetylesterase-family hydrolase, partial [Polyangiaceae bacterium]
AGDSGTATTDASSCAPNTTYPQTSFVNLGVTLGAPLSQVENDAIPMGDGGTAMAPAGWNFYGQDGAVCRDGSPAGFYVHWGTTNKLFIYLEGGGACDSATFCSHNPANIATVFSGGEATQGQQIGGSLGFSSTPQAPYVPTPQSGFTAATSPGIFDFTQSANPFQTWSGVYVPYCTGDVHFGTADGVTIPGDGVLPALTNQHFVGHLNLEKFIARIVPTFPSVTQVVLTGASAGGFAAGLNLGMVQDSFGTSIPVTVIDDSGPPMSEQYLAPCLMKQWRDLWGFAAALPSDCAECTQPDGSGMTNIVYYWLHKYPNAKVGLVSTMQDEVIRLFFAQGYNSCASTNATALSANLGNAYPGAQYTAGLNDLLTTFQCTGRLATYFIGGTNPNYMHPTYHQHIFRDEFYKAITNDGSITMAQWATDFVNGTMDNVGP